MQAPFLLFASTVEAKFIVAFVIDVSSNVKVLLTIVNIPPFVTMLQFLKSHFEY